VRSFAQREPVYKQSGTVILTEFRGRCTNIVAHVMRAWAAGREIRFFVADERLTKRKGGGNLCAWRGVSKTGASY